MQPWNAEVSVNNLFWRSSANESCPQEVPYIYESTEVRVCRLSAEAVFAFLGLIGNIFVASIKLEHLRMSKSVGVCIRNLALADIGVLLFDFPFALAKEQEATHDWVLGSAGCRVAFPFSETFYGASTWSLAVIAIQRYRIYKGNNYSWNPRGSKYANWRIIAIIWIASFLLYSVPLFFACKLEVACGKRICYNEWPYADDNNNIPAKLHSLSLLLTLYILPICIIAWTYSRTSRQHRRKVRRHRRRRRTQFNSISSNLIEEEEAIRAQLDEIKRIQIPLVIIFVITMFPLNLLRLLFVVFVKELSLEKYLAILNVSIMFIVSNSVFRPCVYYIVSRDIREGYRRAWRRFQGCLRCKFRGEESLFPLQDLGADVVSITSTSTLSRYKETTL